MSNFFKNPFKKKKRDFQELLEKNQELQEELTKERQKSEGLQVQLSMSESKNEELLKQKDSDLTQAKKLIGSLKLRAQTDVKKQRALKKELSCQKRLVEDKSKTISWLSEALRDAKKQLAELNKEDLAKPYLLEQTLKVKLEEELAKKEKERQWDSQRQLEQFDVEVKRFQDVVSMKEQNIKSLTVELKAAAEKALEQALEQEKIQTELQEELKEERDITAGLYKLLEQKEKERHWDSQRLIDQFNVEVKRLQDIVSRKEQDIKSLTMKLKAAEEEAQEQALEQEKIQTELQEELKEERDKAAGLYKLLEQKAALEKLYLLEQTLKVKLEEELAKKEKEQQWDSQRLIEQFDVEVKRFQDVVSMKEQDIKSLTMKLKAAAKESLEQEKIQTELQEELKEEREKAAGLYKLLEQKELCLNNSVEILEKKSSENEELREALQTEREKREEERKEKEERERKQAEERERKKKEEEKEREDDRRKCEEKLKVREEEIKARKEAKRARQEKQQRQKEEEFARRLQNVCDMWNNSKYD